MGKLVNEAGYDADSGNAVILLAKKYKFKFGGACEGKEEFEKVIEKIKRETELIIVFSDAVSKKALETVKKKDDPTVLLTDKKLDEEIEWHAVYGCAESKGNIKWDDEKDLPQKKDYILYFVHREEE